MARRRTGHVLDEVGGGVTLPLMMDLFPKPPEKARKLSLGERWFQFAKLSSRTLEELGSVEVAKCIGREVSEETAAPVNVLQTQSRVVSWENSWKFDTRMDIILDE